MFNCIQDQSGLIHIIGYKSYLSHYHTLCSEWYKPGDYYTIFAADDTFSGMCQKCKEEQDAFYKFDLNECPEMARNNTQRKYEDIVICNRYNLCGPAISYNDVRAKYRITRFLRNVPRK